MFELFIRIPVNVDSNHLHVFLLQFEGKETVLNSRIGYFITMNPGYAGRTELPESLKALFRPVVVIVPDLEYICEIMLFAQGFLTARVRFSIPYFTLKCIIVVAAYSFNSDSHK